MGTWINPPLEIVPPDSVKMKKTKLRENPSDLAPSGDGNEKCDQLKASFVLWKHGAKNFEK